MKLIDQTFEILTPIDSDKILRNLEKIGRISYKSENLITEDSAKKFIKKIIENKHEAVIEHENISIKVITDRGVSHEIVRHRIASYIQESTRFCNYSKEKFGNEIVYIKPVDFELLKKDIKLLQTIEQHYLERLKDGLTPQQARYFLPNGLKTEIVITMNLREWRHFFKLRTAKAAHPQMRYMAKNILCKLNELVMVIFEDLGDLHEIS